MIGEADAGEFRNAELSDGGIVIAAVAGLCPQGWFPIRLEVGGSFDFIPVLQIT